MNELLDAFLFSSSACCRKKGGLGNMNYISTTDVKKCQKGWRIFLELFGIEYSG